MSSSTRSKYLSLLLRHQPELKNLELDANGWCNLDQLIKNTDFTISELEKIVEENNKKRFTIQDGKIRAVQGHSIKVELGYESVMPPDKLFHGTKVHHLPIIMAKGLDKMKRHHVHLSFDKETAMIVSQRKQGRSVLLEIDSKSMYESNYKFYLSENKVWLTEHVPAKFIKIVD